MGWRDDPIEQPSAPNPAPAAGKTPVSTTPFVPSGEKNIFGNPRHKATPQEISQAGSGIVGRTADAASTAVEDAAYHAGGGATDLAARAGLSPETSAQIGRATNVGVQALPTLFGMGVGRGAAPILEGTAKNLMQAAVKPNLAFRTADKADRGIETLLKEGISPTPGGAAKLQRAITQLEAEIDAAIQSSTATVDTQKVAQTIKSVINDYKMGLKEAENTAAVDKVEQLFLNHPAIKGIMQLPVQTAQKVKRGIYKDLDDSAYGANLGSNAERDAMKAGARGLKEGVAAGVPQTTAPMKRQSDLINALKMIEPRIAVEANKGSIGMGWLANEPAAALGFAAERDPWVRGLVARGIYAGRERLPEAIGGGIGGIGGAMSGRPNFTPPQEEPR